MIYGISVDEDGLDLDWDDMQAMEA